MTRSALHLGWGLLLTLLGAFFSSQILLKVSPQSAKLWQYIVLYLGVFLFTCGLGLIFGYLARVVFSRQGLKNHAQGSIRRQAVLFGFLGVISLILEAFKMLNLLTAGLLLLISVLIELYSQ